MKSRHLERYIGAGKGKRMALASLLLALPFMPRLAAWLAAKEGERKGYRVEQFKLTARDGTRLSAALYTPGGEGPFPALIMVHSWMLSRWQCHLYAPYFASAGYVVLAYDCRGWGSSQGRVHCADPELEINDLEDAIDWLTRSSGAAISENGLGVTGISYGGGHSFLIAARDSRVRTVVPMCGWTDLESSITPQGSTKIFWGLALLLTASWATGLDPSNVLYRWTRTILLGRGNRREYEEDMRARSALTQVGEVRCPMLIVGAWNDDLFEPNQMMEYYQRLVAPKMLYISNGLHALDAGIGPRFWGRDIWRLTRRWFDYWLKGEENGVLSEPSVRLYRPWARVYRDEPAWPPPDTDIYELYLLGENGGNKLGDGPSKERKGRMLAPDLLCPATSGPSMVRPQAFGIPVPGPRAHEGRGYFSFTSPALGREFELLGVPGLRLVLRPYAKRVQVNVLLYDLPPRGLPLLVTHGTITLEDAVPGEERTAEVELVAVSYLLKKGHRLRLTLAGSDPLFVMPVLDGKAEILFGDGGSMISLPLREVSGT